MKYLKWIVPAAGAAVLAVYLFVFTAAFSDTLTKYNSSVDSKGVCRVLAHIKRIEDRCFWSNHKLKRVVFEGDKVSEIGNYAFSRCINLRDIDIPDSVNSIGNEAFSFCFSLRSVKLPPALKTMGFGVFWTCTDLKSATLPDSLTAIEDLTFSECFALSSLTIPESVTSIGR